MTTSSQRRFVPSGTSIKLKPYIPVAMLLFRLRNAKTRVAARPRSSNRDVLIYASPLVREDLAQTVCHFGHDYSCGSSLIARAEAPEGPGGTSSQRSFTTSATAITTIALPSFHGRSIHPEPSPA